MPRDRILGEVAAGAVNLLQKEGRNDKNLADNVIKIIVKVKKHISINFILIMTVQNMSF